MKLLRRLGFLIIAATVSLGLSCGGSDDDDPPPDPLVRNVATNGTDVGLCLDKNNPCLTLNYAHNVALPRDHIEVKAGNYVFPASEFRIQKPISVNGEARNSTFFSGRIWSDSSIDGQVVLKQFTLTTSIPFTNGIELSRVDRVVIRDVEVSGFGADGILIGVSGEPSRSADSIIITDSKISGNGEDGVKIFAAGTTIDLDGLDASGNFEDGIQVNEEGGHDTNISNTRIVGNTEAGIQIEDNRLGTVDIRNNCIQGQITQAGIFLDNWTDGNLDVDNNAIFGNVHAGAEVTGGTSVAMEDNWWSDASGPLLILNGSVVLNGMGDTAIGPIDVLPFLTAPFPNPPLCP